MPGDELRALFREVPSPVGVVTVAVGGDAAGLTVDSLVSLSTDPPLVGISLGKHAALHELLREAGAFAVSLLAADQDHLAEHFARGVPPIGMWKGVAARDGELGAPLLDGALGWLECRLADEVATGTHTFFVGEVVSAELGEDGVPLVRLGGELRAGS